MHAPVTTARKYRTFLDILNENRGMGPGFDVLRIALALAILWGHANWILGVAGHLSGAINAWFGVVPQHPAIFAQTVARADQTPALDGLTRPMAVSLVPMFFALSGFLVTGSALRTKNVARFLGLRGLRIFPALVVEVTLSALTLGVLLTDVPLGQYLSSPVFYRYLGNMVGWISYRLPGVFDHNAVPLVNANLWTLPSELDCYMISAALIATTLFYRRGLLTIILTVITVVLIALNSVTNFAVTPGRLAGHTITYYFFVGAVFYHWRDRIPYSLTLFLAAGVLTYVLSLSRHTIYLSPVLLTYVTIFIGMTPMPSFSILKSGDYSYGIYLYGFPITQAIWAAFPMLRNNPWGFRVAAFAVTGLFAAASWHLVEKYALRLKKYLSPGSAAIEARLDPAATGQRG
jgi:peptidoglycan/LPS O-acetylase OafA/YrhL